MMNLKIKKVGPLLERGKYKAVIKSFKELSGEHKDKGIIDISINGNLYQIWLDNAKQLTLATGETTSLAQLILDSITNQQAVQKLIEETGVETIQELMITMIDRGTVLDTWCTVFEERLNNFTFYKTKNFDTMNALGL